jgi:hypothetical protein
MRQMLRFCLLAVKVKAGSLLAYLDDLAARPAKFYGRRQDWGVR